jgi:hypothetical protein
MALQPFQFDNLWSALVLWALLYSADYFLTLWGASLMAQVGKTYFDMGGSYELNPVYQKDIDGLRRISPRFILFLVGAGVWLAAMWWSAQVFHVPQAFTAAVGVLLLMEVPVITSHVRNIALFTGLKTPGAVAGHIAYSRWVSLRITVWSFALWGALYALFFALTGSWLFFGGSFSMLMLFIRFSRMSQFFRRRLDAPPSLTEESEV